MPYARRKTSTRPRKVTFSATTRTRTRTPVAKVPKYRRYRKKRVSSGVRPLVPRTLGFAMLPRRFTKMAWEGSFNITATNLASYSNIFRLASLYDPDYSTITKNTSCNGLTLASTLYQNYRVHSTKVIVQFANMSAYNILGVLTFSNENNFSSSLRPSDIAMRPGAVSKLITPLAAPGCRVSMSRYIPIHNVFGCTKREYIGDPRYAAAMSASPALDSFAGITIGGMPDNYSSYTAPVSAMVTIRMIFYVELFDLVSGIGTAS